MTRDDKEIIKDIKNGKKEAVEELIKKHQKNVYNMIYGLTFDYDNAWDISQEVFVKIIKNIYKFREESSFTTFLYRVTMNAFYDFKRKEKIRKKFLNFSDMEKEEKKRVYEVKYMLNIEEDFEKKHLLDKIKDAVSELTDIQRSIFLMKNNQGLKIREIAKVLNLAEGTVKVHLNRAFLKIKEKIKEGDEIEKV